jgi:Peptidase family M48
MYSQRHGDWKKALARLAISVGFSVLTAFGRDSAAPIVGAAGVDLVIDGAIASEHSLIGRLKTMQPVVETYIQEQRSDPELGTKPAQDHYFLGRLDLSSGVNEHSYIPMPSFRHRLLKFRLLSWNLNMSGWAQPALMDYDSFDRQHYQFAYVRREFLGEVRCIVLDVKPKSDAGTGRFTGRIWVEDEGYHVVRFNGTYGPSLHGQFYFHFDSWRMNAAPNLWIPAAVYAEERDLSVGFHQKKRFNAQIRYWGYQLTNVSKEGEYTNLTVDAENGANDVSDKTTDNSPVMAVRLWERQAEDNVLDRLEKSGFLALKGEVDRVLETVLNNIEVTNDINIDPPVRVRVLLTTPFESFAVGHTIVISRGLLDVLPDEASLAAILSLELAHVSLAHTLDTKFAFTDRLFFDDEATIKKMSFTRSPKEEADADAKALEFLKKSPYAAKLSQTGLFLRQLSAWADQMPNLIRPLLGNGIAEASRKGEAKDLRLSGLTETAPPLRPDDTTQVSALPLGSRIKMDPWTDGLALTKAPHVAIMTPREKLPFEVTPFMLHLTRLTPPGAGATAALPTK